MKLQQNKGTIFQTKELNKVCSFQHVWGQNVEKQFLEKMLLLKVGGKNFFIRILFSEFKNIYFFYNNYLWVFFKFINLEKISILEKKNLKRSGNRNLPILFSAFEFFLEKNYRKNIFLIQLVQPTINCSIYYQLLVNCLLIFDLLFSQTCLI